MRERTSEMLDKVLTHIVNRMNEDTETPIEFCAFGFRDVTTVPHSPALLMAETSRDLSRSYFTVHRLSVALIVRNQDDEECQRLGVCLSDRLEDILRADPSLGGLVCSSALGSAQMDFVPGTFGAFFDLTVEIDLGSTEPMGR